MSKQAELVKLFDTAAKILDLKGEVPFKAISFQKVARLLKDGEVDVEAAYAAGELEKVKGIGKSSAEMIREYLDTGRSTDYDELAASIPAGLVPMFALPGMGPKTIKLLWEERDVKSVEELAAAIDGGKLKGVKGIGPKKIEQLKEAIDLAKKAGGRRGIWQIEPVAEGLVKAVASLVGVAEAQAAGSLRRRQETCKDLDIIAKLEPEADGDAVTGAFAAFGEVEKVLVRGPTKCSVLVADGLQVDLRCIPPQHFGAALIHFTGSKDHNKRIRGLALDKEQTLNEWGLYKSIDWEKAERKAGFPPDNVKPVASETEAAVYEALGLVWVPPELREDRGEVEQAAADELPALIEAADLRADLHTHTVASDGRASIEEMAEAAKALGHVVLGITDHSKSQAIANGLDADRLMKHVEAIRGVNERVRGITLLAGSEVDILADGSLDYPDDVLRELDFCVASPHVALRQDREKSTARLLRAIDNKYVTIIGHPTGRYINKRPGLSPDMAKIFQAAAASGTALEINASYPRLDLSDNHARQAKAAGVMLSINTDAHSTDGLQGARGGIDVARRAGLTKGDVLNTRTPKQILDFIAKKRK
jgi:DNA polymerase (family 10)